MKRKLSLVLCLSMLCCMLLGIPMITNAGSVRTDKVWYEADFEDGTTGDVVMRGSASLEIVNEGTGGHVLHVTERDGWVSGIWIDVSDMLQKTDVQDGEGYSAGFRMKAEEGQEFWLEVEMIAPKVDAGSASLGTGNFGRRIHITDEWTTVSLGKYYFKSDDKTDWANTATLGNIGFTAHSAEAGWGPSAPAFYIDDVQVSAPVDEEEGTEPGPGESGGIWYDTDFEDQTTGYVEMRDKAVLELVSDGADGNALYVTREAWYAGVWIDVSEMLQKTDIQEGGGYSIGFRMKAKEGENFWLQVEMIDPEEGGSLPTGSLGQRIRITDEWTTVSLGDYYFKSEAGDQAWANAATVGYVAFTTFPEEEGWGPTTQSFYLDDVQVSAPVGPETPPEKPDPNPDEDPEPGEEPAYTETFNNETVGELPDTDGALKIENDPAQARDGNYLRVVERKTGEANGFYWYNVNEFITAQGAGKYELKFYAKAEGEGTQILVLKGDTYLNPQATNITTEWAQYTITLDTAENVITETDLESGVNLVFSTGYDGKSNDLFLDDISFVRTGAYTPGEDPDPGEDPEPEPSDGPFLDVDGSFETISEATYWDHQIVKDGDAQDGDNYLHVVNRKTGEEAAICGFALNLDKLREMGVGNYKVSFWLRAVNSGEQTQASAYIIAKENGADQYGWYFQMSPKTPAGNEWIQFTSAPLSTTDPNLNKNLLEMDSATLYIINAWTPEYVTDFDLDNVTFTKTDEQIDPNPGGEEPEPGASDETITDGGFENPAETEQWNGVVIHDADEAAEGERYLHITDRPTEGQYYMEQSVWGTLVNLDKLRADEGGNYKLSFWLRAANVGEQTTVGAYIVGTKGQQEFYDWYFNMVPAATGVNGATAGDEWVHFESAPLSLDSLMEMDRAMLVITNWYENITDCDLDGVALTKTDETPIKDMAVEPEYTYDNPANLLDPYGDFDKLEDGNTLWNGVVVADPDGAHSGDNYLLISDRTAGNYRFDFSLIGLQDVIRDNGAGKYYYSCWLKTKNAGETTVLQPILYYDDTGAEYWMSPITVTDEWTFFGVTYDDVNNFFNAESGGLPVPGGVAEFRFYNAPGEESYPDYCIDDLAFWKYYEEQSAEQPDDGNQSQNPNTGVGVPMLPLAVTALAGGCLIAVRRRRTCFNRL